MGTGRGVSTSSWSRRDRSRERCSQRASSGAGDSSQTVRHLLLASGCWPETILVSFASPILQVIYSISLPGHKYGYLSRMSPSNFHSETEDSGFESLVTVTSDSSSNSSRIVSPPPASQPRHHQYERANYQHFNR